MNNLPKVVTWQCPGSESNLQPRGYEFGTLPLHHQADFLVGKIFVQKFTIRGGKNPNFWGI